MVQKMSKFDKIFHLCLTVLAWWIFYGRPFELAEGCAFGMVTGVVVSLLTWGDKSK